MCFKCNLLASFTAFALTAIIAVGILTDARGEDQKADPSGTWSWTAKGRQGAPDRKITAKLKANGDKLTGTISSPGRDGATHETDITDGKVKGDEVTFSTTREVNGTKVTYKYSGKLSGDTIKGKMEFERNGEQLNREWEAKREK
jgi:hypothetical protein